jgi:lipopolysaccharide exporter
MVLVLKRWWQKVTQLGSFGRAMAQTLTGAMATTLVSLVLMPIITRLYTPHEYGLMSLMLAMSNILGMGSTLFYQHAFILPEDMRELDALVKLTLVLTGVSTLVCVGVAWIGYGLDVLPGTVADLGGFVFFVPLLSMLTALGNVLHQYMVRQKQFGVRAQSMAFGNLFGKLYAVVSGGFFTANLGGLVYGQVLGGLLKICWVFRSVEIRFWSRAVDVPMGMVGDVAGKYRSYPRYYLPSFFANQLSNDLPLYVVGYWYGNTFGGQYSMAYNLLQIPLNVLGVSSSPVLMRQGQEVLAAEGMDGLHAYLYGVGKRLFVWSLLPLGVCCVWGDVVFAWVLGSGWKTASVFGAGMAVYTIFQVVYTALSGMFRVLRKEYLAFRSNVLLLALRAVGLGVGAKWGVYGMMLGYSVASVLGSLGQGYVLLVAAEMPRKVKHLAWAVGVSALYIGVLYGLRKVLWG